MAKVDVDMETIEIEIPKDDAERLWFLLLDIQRNDTVRVTTMRETDPKTMGMSELQKRKAISSVLSEINMIQNVMRSIKSKLPK